ncbi:MAG: serine/threonine-protein kinase, partial [Acidobacteriota bacterium]
MRLAPGHRLGNYEVIGALGAGGMGEVYEARDLRLGRKVALKVLGSESLDPISVRRLEQEARAASVLNHPNIVTIYGVGEEGDNTFIAMEFVQGTTLRVAMTASTLPIERTLDIAVQLSEAMAAAHAAGIVHRDLKPENVILTPDGVAKVLDFGLARRRAVDDNDETTAPRAETIAPLTNVGVIVGTVGYMSPEQAAGKPVGPQSDQFSFGIILYEMLSGMRPFRRATEMETLAAIINLPPEPVQSLNACVPDPLGRLVDRLLAKSPSDRFEHTRDLASHLRQMRSQSNLAYLDQPAAASAPTARMEGGVPRRYAIWIGGAAITAAVAAAVTWARWPAASGEHSLAVLPFGNGGATPESEYLSDGITESLIERVSRVPSIKVKARSTVFAFKGKAIDPLAIGKQLSADAILTGTITQRGERIAVSVELVDVATGTRMWGQTYDRAASDLLPLQDEIATAVVNEGFKLHPNRVAANELTRKPTDDPEAYEFYLRARH